MLTFSEAVALWRTHRDAVEDKDWLRLERAEKAILAHRPQTHAEAASIVDVLLEQADSRPDGLNVRALQHLSYFLAGYP